MSLIRLGYKSKEGSYDIMLGVVKISMERKMSFWVEGRLKAIGEGKISIGLIICVK
jgi:hypothetical protein